MAKPYRRVRSGALGDYWKHDRQPKPPGFWCRPAARGEILVVCLGIALVRAMVGWS